MLIELVLCSKDEDYVVSCIARKLFFSSYVISIQLDLHVLCHCVKHVGYDIYIMFVCKIDASMRDLETLFY